MPQGSETRTLLIVDNQPLVLDLLVDILQEHGFLCRRARNGLEALHACATAVPDLIVMDLRMPEMDGVATCRRLKANPAWAAIPIVAVTTQSDPATVAVLREVGCAHHVPKPFTPQRLLATVRAALDAPPA